MLTEMFPCNPLFWRDKWGILGQPWALGTILDMPLEKEMPKGWLDILGDA